MALDLTRNCIIYTDDVAVFLVRNETTYGLPEQDRNAAAEVLIVAHVDTDGVETFATVENNPVTTLLEYTVNNTIDGHYRIERLRIPFYDNVADYLGEIRDVNDIITTYGNIVYYATTNSFYKAILDSNGILPDAVTGPTYWLEILDFTNPEIRVNSTIEVGVTEDVYDARGKICVKNELYRIVEKGCGCTDSLEKMLPFFKKKALLSGARSKAKDGYPEKAEDITRYLEEICPKCGC